MAQTAAAWRRMARGLLSVCLGLALSLSGPAMARQEPPRQRLEQAIAIYGHGGYLEASAQLSSLLYPLKLTDKKDILRAKVYLGLCYYILERKDDAAEEFRDVFKIDPGFQPDPLDVPAELIKFIEALRPQPFPQQVTALEGLGETMRGPEPVTPQFSPLNLLPAGIPQLIHGDTGRGVLLLSSQTLLLGINVGSYWYLRLYNDEVSNPASRYPWLVGSKAANISSLALVTTTAVIGVGDALYRYRRPPKQTGLRFSVAPGTAMLRWEGRF